MKTFLFYHKNSSHTMAISAYTFEDAYEELTDEVKDVWGWRCDDEDGESED
jgi:hypothetical protein